MEFFEALENTWPGLLIRTEPWGFPILEIVHLCGLTVVFGGMVLLDFRIMGLGRSWSVTMLSRYILRFVWAGFALAAFAGVWLFIFEATTLVRDTPFLIKMVLIPLAGLNALFMHFVAMKNIDRWDRDAAPPLVARVSAGASLLLWTGILACGRLIAYFYPPPTFTGG